MRHQPHPFFLTGKLQVWPEGGTLYPAKVRCAFVRRHARIGGRTAGMLVVLFIALLAFLPARALAGSYGNTTVTGNGITTSGTTIVVNDSGAVQSNVGAAQSAGSASSQTDVTACVTGSSVPAVMGSISAGSSIGGSASAGTSTAGTSTAGTSIGGNAVGGNAVGGNAVGSNAVGGNAAGATQSAAITRNGSAVGGSAIGGSAVGGSAVNGSVVTGTPSQCGSVSNGVGAASVASQANQNAIVCGAVTSSTGTTLTISTLSTSINVTIQAGTNVVGVLPATGNVCLLLTSSNGTLVAIHVLSCHGSTTGAVTLPSSASSNASVLVQGNTCGQYSLHTNTESSAGGSSSTVDIDCPDPCSPTTPAASTGGTASLPAQTPLQISTGPANVLSSGPGQSTAATSTAILALRLSDLPSGFQQTRYTSLDNVQVAQGWHMPLAAVEALGHLAASESAFHQATSSGTLAVDDRVDVYRSTAAAHLSFVATSATIAASYRAAHPHVLKKLGVGKESIEFSSTSGANGARTTTIEVVFRRGRYVATITIKGRSSLVTTQQALTLGRILDTRIQAQS